MSELLPELILRSAEINPEKDALSYKDQKLTYDALASGIVRVASGFIRAGLARAERVAVYLPKRIESVEAMFGTSMAGGVFVPVNPLLKPEQVVHILRDCNVRILVTTSNRAIELTQSLSDCHDLQTLVLVDPQTESIPGLPTLQVIDWHTLVSSGEGAKAHRVIDADMAAILYTSGSTGKPKGVVLSHRNIVAGAKSVAHYIDNRSTDRVLCALPFSFDYGFSQLSTMFWARGCAVLMEYLVPRDIIKAVVRSRITGLAGVPSLWNQLSHLEWPTEATQSLRYITNSGGAMPRTTLATLRSTLPYTQVFLMYGLTEAFRSTYLPPEEVDSRPDSMGKAIPNAEVLVVREDGAPCAPDEPGELVHRGALVAMGYWNNPEKTAVRFRPSPNQDRALVLPENAVWSGDMVRMDEDGYLYFVGRRDDMIKTAGYRVSPTEVEEVAYATGLIGEASAIGIPHPDLGQAIVLVAIAKHSNQRDTDAVLAECKRRLPNFMVPARIVWRETLPKNPNGKIDRKFLATEFQDLF